MFVDFQDCFALKCGRCGCGFCAHCLKDCGGDAHAHVMACPHNPNRNSSADDGFAVYDGSQAQFRETQRRRRERMVMEYLGTLDAAMRARVVAACRLDLDTLGIRLVG